MDITKNFSIKPIFNFNFSTMLLFRCTKRKYAEDFINGKIFFNQPKNWIQYEKDGDNRRGDILEGTFLSTNSSDSSPFVIQLKEDKSLYNFTENDMTYFRRKQIDDVYSICFYGLKDNSFQEKNIDEYGKAHYLSKVEKSYFTDFSDNLTEQDYFKLCNDEKPVVLFINNPHSFFEKIKEALESIGVKEDEILISPIEYINKSIPSIAAIPYPMELLLKDESYANQNEVRIIVNSNNPAFIKYMQDNNNIINIGNISEIAEIYDYYFKDLLIERTGKKEIIFTLPKERVEAISEMNLYEILSLMSQVSSERVPTKMSEMEKSDFLKFAKKIIKDRFDAEVECNDGNINISNASESVINYLDKISKPYQKTSNFEKEISSLIADKKCNEAMEKIQNSDTDEELRELGIFYKGKIMQIQRNFEEAIKSFTYCIINEIKKADALSARANCFYSLKKYDLALNDLEELQETIGYNPEIYTNKGINYLSLNKLGEAKIQFDKSLCLSEHNPAAYYNRSVANFRLSNYIQAKNDIEKALEYDPNNQFYIDSYNKFYKQL